MNHLLVTVLTLTSVSLPAGTPAPTASPTAGRPIKVLFLGHERERIQASPAVYTLLGSPLARRGIQLTHAANAGRGAQSGEADVLRRPAHLR